ncbi:type 1 glutamine amidotransferase [Achromobacter animicus]
MTPRVAIIETMENTQLGLLLSALNKAQADITWFRVYRDGLGNIALDDFDALIVPGGWPSAQDDDLYPYLPKLVALMRTFGDAGKSVLGICLGAQVLARAYGADNLLGVAREFSWTPLTVTDDGRADPLFAELHGGFTSFQWHVDTYTLPPSALLLARSEMVQNQCFRVGRATYGMQFHFEASGDVVHDWTRANPDRVNRIAPGWLETQAAEDRARFAADADEAGARIARAFVATIGQRART